MRQQGKRLNLRPKSFCLNIFSKTKVDRKSVSERSNLAVRMSLQVLGSDQSPSVDHCMAYALMPRNQNPNNLTPRIVPRLLPLMESRARTIEKPFP